MKSKLAIILLSLTMVFSSHALKEREQRKKLTKKEIAKKIGYFIGGVTCLTACPFFLVFSEDADYGISWLDKPHMSWAIWSLNQMNIISTTDTWRAEFVETLKKYSVGLRCAAAAYAVAGTFCMYKALSGGVVPLVLDKIGI